MKIENIYSRGKLPLTFVITLGTFMIVATSCKKFVTVEVPPTQLATAVVFSNDATAAAAINGVYSSLMNFEGFTSGQYTSITALGSLSSDELVGTAYPNTSDPYKFYTNSLQSNTFSLASAMWTEPYKTIFQCNTVIEAVEKSAGLSPATRSQVEGEALFIRAFCYFYLTSMFGDVPLALSTDWQVNTSALRSPQASVYQQVISDLKAAQQKLAEEYTKGDSRIYVNKSSATALLARTYLYAEDWANAEIEASKVIGNTGLYRLEDLDNVFLIPSKEIIWQLKPHPDYGTNTQEGALFILEYAPNYQPFLSQAQLASFDPNDNRKAKWVGSYSEGADTWYFSYKQKYNYMAPSTFEYTVVMRLSEQYLIRAEAMIQQGKIAEGIADINTIRERASMAAPNLIELIPVDLSKGAALLAVEHERQTELFCEWAHRWFDLKRTKRADAVLKAKGPEWQSTDVLYPIPSVQITNNPATTQNPGYQ